MPFSEVRTGARGTGKTVFQGGRSEPFDVEVIGTLEKVGPGQNLILVRLTGGPLAQTGILEGMSGSPVTLDGRLIGAVAYSWSFAREPIAGITPIEEMIRLAAETPIGPPAPGSGQRAGRALDFLSRDGADILTGARETISRLFAPASGGAVIAPLPPVLAVSGIPVSSLAPARAVAAGASAAEAGGGAAPLAGGDAVAAALVRGDVTIAAVGTATRVEGGKVLAFGHPFLNLGPVSLPMMRARVEALLPSLASSFKFAVPGGEIGAWRTDRMSGMSGVLGERADMIPLHVTLSLPGGVEEKWNYEVAAHNTLAPTLVFITVGGLLGRQQTAQLPMTVAWSEGSAITLSGGRRVRITGFESGEDAAFLAPARVALLTQALLENEFERVRIEGITLAARVAPGREEAQMLSAWCDRATVHPGDTVTLNARLHPYRGPERTVSIPVAVPEELAPGPLVLHVGDAFSQYREEASEGALPIPRDVDDLVRMLSDLRRGDRLYVLAMRQEEFPVVNGLALPGLPASRGALLLSPQSGGQGRVVRGRVVAEQFAEAGTAVEGDLQLMVEVVP